MMRTPAACFVSIVRPARDMRTFHKEARSLAAAGWRVSVVGPDPEPARRRDGIDVLPRPRARGAARPLVQLRALRRALATRADVYQVTDVELLPAAFLLKRLGRTVVYDCIEDYPAYMRQKAWIPARLRPWAALAVERIERLVTPRLDAAITADEGTAARLAGYGASVTVVHNFPRRDEFAPAPADAPRPYDVVYHGSLPAHQLEALTGIASSLARRLPTARWTIVGEPDGRGGRAEFAAALARAGLDERVELRARIPFPEVPGLLAGARTGVVPLPDLPKFRTNVPMKLFEYMAAGVPAVASDLPPARRLLGGTGAAMLVPPGDHAAFAAALGDLLRHPGWAAELARRGREAVRDRFHWEGEEERLVRLYARLLCGPGLRSAMEQTLA